MRPIGQEDFSPKSHLMPAEFDITGKVVFITGAGHGIGKGIAQVLAEAGGDIVLNALTPTYVEGTLRHPKKRM
jgi:enoyl-[acyl-carrier-protein] reductase (NADH)